MSDPKLEEQIETYFAKGDSIYNIYADPSIDVFEKEGEYPNISLFTLEGEYNPEWDERGLTNVSRDESGVITGTNIEGNIETRNRDRTVTRGVSGWHGSPRQSYLREKMSELGTVLDESELSNISKSMMKSGYGFRDDPRYTKKGEMWSPFKLAQIYRGETKDMDWRERREFDTIFGDVVGDMTTEKPTTNDKVFEAINE